MLSRTVIIFTLSTVVLVLLVQFNGAQVSTKKGPVLVAIEPTLPTLASYDSSDGPSVKAINRSLTGKKGNRARGERIIAQSAKGNCFACHEISRLIHKEAANPGNYADMGDVGPRLDGIASRYTAGELRMLLVDSKEVFPQTIMPSFYRTAALHRVNEKFVGKSVLSAQEVEDVLAYVITLKEPHIDLKKSVISTVKSPAIGTFKIVDGPLVKAIKRSLTGKSGNGKRGENLMAEQTKGNCFACHEVRALKHKERTNPDKYADMGKIGPPLDGVASRYSVGELRMLLVDSKQINPDSIMPSFLRTKKLHRVGATFADKSILSRREVEDILAFLRTLKD